MRSAQHTRRQVSDIVFLYYQKTILNMYIVLKVKTRNSEAVGVSAPNKANVVFRSVDGGSAPIKGNRRDTQTKVVRK